MLNFKTNYNKYFKIITFLIISNLTLLSHANNSQLAIIDMQLLINRSIAVKKIKTDIENLTKEIQTNLDQKIENLKNQEKILQQKKTELNEKVFEQELLKFNKQVTNLQKQAQKSKSKIEQIYASAMNIVQNKIFSIISEVAREKEYELVLPQSITIYHLPKLNITDLVAQKLNLELNNVPITMEDQ